MALTPVTFSWHISYSTWMFLHGFWPSDLLSHLWPWPSTVVPFVPDSPSCSSFQPFSSQLLFYSLEVWILPSTSLQVCSGLVLNFQLISYISNSTCSMLNKHFSIPTFLSLLKVLLSSMSQSQTVDVTLTYPSKTNAVLIEHSYCVPYSRHWGYDGELKKICALMELAHYWEWAENKQVYIRSDGDKCHGEK